LIRRPGFAITASLALAVGLTACGNVLGIHDLALGSSASTTTSSQGGASSGGGEGGHGGAASGGGEGGHGGATSVTTGESATASAGTTASASSGGPALIVFCNDAPCAADEICCFNTTQQSDHCGKSGTCGSGFVEFHCNGPEDCPGGICCADLDLQKNPPYKGISCQQTCISSMTNLIVCSDADPACPPGKQCSTSMVLGQGYKICK
jgi:hypothetical protein